MRLLARGLQGTKILVLGLLVVGVPLSAGCFGRSDQRSEQRLNGGGATFIYPMMSKWTAEYDKATGVKVNYQSIGSGGGIQQMTAKTFDFGCSDGPMNEEQLKKAREVSGEVFHIPLVMGAVVPAYNLEEVKETLRFNGPVLADIFLGKIKKWNDPALQDLNPKAALPDKEIVVVHRSDGSGTTYIWVDYLAKVSSEWKTRVGVGTSVNWPCGVGQKGNEGVAGQVKRSPGSLGYIELIYALQNDIKFGLVQNKEGEFIKASLESVTAAAAAALADIPDDLRYSITNAPGKGVYPISGTSWAILYVNQPAGKGKAVVDFLRWCTHEGQKYTEELHYARLPPGLIERLEKKLDQVNVGK
jgi:phosphate ABC transporter phosphate-binding protein